MGEYIEQKPFFKLRYWPINHKKNGCAIDIERLIGETGLTEGRHYSIGPIEITDNSFKSALSYFGAVLLQINPHNPFGFQEGILGGYSLVGNFLKKNKGKIKRGLENLS